MSDSGAESRIAKLEELVAQLLAEREELRSATLHVPAGQLRIRREGTPGQERDAVREDSSQIGIDPSTTSVMSQYSTNAVADTTEFEDVHTSEEKVRESARHILGVTETKPTVAIVCGSGLGNMLTDHIKEPQVLNFSDIPNFARTTVQGHKGRLVFGELQGNQVVVMEGRLHYYEGLPMEAVARPVRVLKEIGVETLILTNAAGGVHPSLKVGDVMMITDHISFANIAGNSPLRGRNEEYFGPRFIDMGMAYSARLKRLSRECAKEHNVDIKEGVFGFVAGPQFETPSESKLLFDSGASAVSMSTIPEVVFARHCGMRVLAYSTISNACGHTLSEDETEYLKIKDLDVHSEVLATVEREAIPKLRKVLLSLLEKIATDKQWEKDGAL